MVLQIDQPAEGSTRSSLLRSNTQQTRFVTPNSEIAVYQVKRTTRSGSHRCPPASRSANNCSTTLIHARFLDCPNQER